jgi:serine/threonine protein kinase
LNDSFLHSFVQHISKSKSIKEIPSKNRYEEEFEEIKLIATGGYGLVYAVRHKLDKIDYAIKIIDLNKIGNDGIAMKETQTLAKLDNEFIVRYKSSWVENKIDRDVYYIQMELCDGNLRDLMDQVNQDSNLKKVDILSLIGYYFCTHIMEEIFEGVNYLHKLSPIIIHRDLKPSNILIKFILNGKVIRIADFSSVANHGFSDQSHTDDRGTPKYMAPEVISNRNYDEKADIYSLGIIWSKLFDVDMNR